MEDLQEVLTLSLARQDVIALIGSIQRTLHYWEEHYLDDGQVTHDESEYVEVLRQYGELLWRLESVAAPDGDKIQHSEGAVRPAGAVEDGRVHSTAADAEAALTIPPQPPFF